jgi:tryptophanyl-tRNA synthetase
VVLKRRLADVLNAFLDPMRARRAEHAKDPNAVYAMLQNGTAKARAVAADTIKSVKEAMQILYW